MSVFTTWFGTRSFSFIYLSDVSPPATGMHYEMPGWGDTIWILLPATVGCRWHHICLRGNEMFRS